MVAPLAVSKAVGVDEAPLSRRPAAAAAVPEGSKDPDSGTRAGAYQASILVVDDEPDVLRSICRLLREQGYTVTATRSGVEATHALRGRSFDVIVSDIKMPGMDGIQLLREVRERDLHVPVVLMTGEPAVSTAVQALEYGAFHYLTKPVDVTALEQTVARAISMHRMARVKQQAAELLGHAGALGADRAGLEASFERTMQTLWVAFHPIVDARRRTVFGYEALMRSKEPSLPHPGAVIDAATRLGRLEGLGRLIRSYSAQAMPNQPNGLLFVNLHIADLMDPELSSPDAPLSKIASRVVLEVTERSSLDEVKDVRARVAALREMGYRIAVDDLGAGYASLAMVAELRPDVIKIDMSLVRGVRQDPTRLVLLRALIQLGTQLGIATVAEGIEANDDLSAVIDAGGDLFQGYLFARPATTPPPIDLGAMHVQLVDEMRRLPTGRILPTARQPRGRSGVAQVLCADAQAPLIAMAALAHSLQGGATVEDQHRIADEILTRVAQVDALLAALAGVIE